MTNSPRHKRPRNSFNDIFYVKKKCDEVEKNRRFILPYRIYARIHDFFYDLDEVVNSEGRVAAP